MSDKRKLRTTPGVLFLLSAVPAAILPPAIVYWSLFILARSEVQHELVQKSIQNFYLRVTATIVILAAYSSLKRVWRRILRRQDRSRLGTDVVEAPCVRGILPWNLDVLRDGVKARKTGM